jgi:hypothetical protein
LKVSVAPLAGNASRPLLLLDVLVAQRKIAAAVHAGILEWKSNCCALTGSATGGFFHPGDEDLRWRILKGKSQWAQMPLTTLLGIPQKRSSV